MNTCLATPGRSAGRVGPVLEGRCESSFVLPEIEWEDEYDVLENRGTDGQGVDAKCSVETMDYEVVAVFSFSYHKLDADNRLYNLTSICEEVALLLHERLGS